jgi:hypothetical protein
LISILFTIISKSGYRIINDANIANIFVELKFV